MLSRPVLYLHIGAMKTGTTYLQSLMYANRQALLDAGVLLPGTAWHHQLLGVQDVMRMGRSDPFIKDRARGGWQHLLEEVFAHPDRTSLISMEFLSFAGRRHVRQLMSTLDGVDVRVLLTVRDMTAALPSLWQTLVHNGGTTSWPAYLAGVPRPSSRVPPLLEVVRPVPGEFHRVQNVSRMLDAWVPRLSPGALTVVTVPRRPTHPDELWHRFAGVLGVDPGVAKRPARMVNPSLGYASSELLRRVNRKLDGVTVSEYNETVKLRVALTVLAERARLEDRARLSRQGYDRAIAWNAHTRAAIAGAGIALAGDLADLPDAPDPQARGGCPAVPPEPPVAEMLDAAATAGRAFTRLAKRRVRRLRQAGLEAARADRPAIRRLRPGWEAADDPAGAAAAEVADRATEAALLLRRLRREVLPHQGR
jgi:hypothetical protein